MNFVDFVFFVYIFIGLYMLILMLSIYYIKRNELFDYPKGKPEPVSIVVPCYNESKSIGKTIESLLNLNYPKDMLEIIVVDDRSKDNSVEIIKEYQKKYPSVRLIVNERNSGGAAEPTNLGIKAARYNYIAVTDADSFPDKNNLFEMIGFLQNDPKVAAVTCRVLASKPGNFIQYLQAIEYKVIAFGRKLLDFVDSVYVTPGPFALYKKKALLDVGLFDTKNMTQDIEIVWRLLSKGYRVRMSLSARVHSNTPATFKGWWRQRIRWNIGGKQTLLKYKWNIFRNGMLGYFIIPFFSFSLFLGLFGLGLFGYLLTKRIILNYLLTKYSIYAGASAYSLEDITFRPSILNFFGITLFVLNLLFVFTMLYVLKDENRYERKIFKILFYLLAYLAVYPFLMIVSIYKMARGKYSW